MTEAGRVVTLRGRGGFVPGGGGKRRRCRPNSSPDANPNRAAEGCARKPSSSAAAAQSRPCWCSAGPCASATSLSPARMGRVRPSSTSAGRPARSGASTRSRRSGLKRLAARRDEFRRRRNEAGPRHDFRQRGRDRAARVARNLEQMFSKIPRGRERVAGRRQIDVQGCSKRSSARRKAVDRRSGGAGPALPGRRDQRKRRHPAKATGPLIIGLMSGQSQARDLRSAMGRIRYSGSSTT